MQNFFATWTQEIGPIFRAARKQRARTVVIVLEVALTLAIAVNCINLILDLRRTMARPSGFDEENLLSVTISPFAEEYRAPDALVQARRADLELLRALPGVRSASGASQVPLSGSGSSTGRIDADSKNDPINTPYFIVTPDFVETMGLEIVAGRDLTAEDLLGPENRENVLLTQEMANALFPDGNAVGKQIVSGSRESANTVVGIVSHMANSWPSSPNWKRVMLVPGDPGFQNFYSFVVRVKPTRLDEVRTRVEKALIEKNPGRLVQVRSLTEHRANFFRGDDSVIKVLSVVIVLLVAVTALGIAGLTSFSVTQRTQQIGTRRALGATRADILRHFLVENWIVTSLGLTLGTVGCFGLHFLLQQWADAPRLPLPLILAGMVALWVTGLASSLAPAWRATSIAPVVATRSV